MGKFSRYPQIRATDAVAKHYVSERPKQQAGSHSRRRLESPGRSRRLDTEVLGDRFIGDDVPGGSDGFRIFGFRHGTLLVGGKVVQIDADFHHTNQRGSDVQFLAYLETWEREVDSGADAK
jgi:hypothetical protein